MQTLIRELRLEKNNKNGHIYFYHSLRNYGKVMLEHLVDVYMRMNGNTYQLAYTLTRARKGNTRQGNTRRHKVFIYIILRLSRL